MAIGVGISDQREDLLYPLEFWEAGGYKEGKGEERKEKKNGTLINSKINVIMALEVSDSGKTFRSLFRAISDILPPHDASSDVDDKRGDTCSRRFAAAKQHPSPWLGRPVLLKLELPWNATCPLYLLS